MVIFLPLQPHCKLHDRQGPCVLLFRIRPPEPDVILARLGLLFQFRIKKKKKKTRLKLVNFKKLTMAKLGPGHMHFDSK